MGEWENQRSDQWAQLGGPPAPMICPQCNKITDWDWIEDGHFWELAGDWWADPQAPDGKGYVCSRRCWRKRSEAKA